MEIMAFQVTAIVEGGGWEEDGNMDFKISTRILMNSTDGTRPRGSTLRMFLDYSILGPG